MKPMLLWSYAVLLGIVSCATARAQSQTCTDIRTVDIAIATIHLVGPEADANRIGGRYKNSFNAPGGERTVHFNRGKFLYRSSHTQWFASLLQNQLIEPLPGVFARVLEVSVGNMGDGAWKYAIVVGCRQGELVPLFQHSGWGVSRVHVNDGTISFTQEIWRKDDSLCCPSLETRMIYAWDSAARTLVRKEESRAIPAEH